MLNNGGTWVTDAAEAALAGTDAHVAECAPGWRWRWSRTTGPAWRTPPRPPRSPRGSRPPWTHRTSRSSRCGSSCAPAPTQARRTMTGSPWPGSRPRAARM
ncbi:ALF repeat-containing protein [Streptomyces sp. TRM72054]|uniref:ALF repeat-containing protein n=1 Tax=Streptomyces sp. TRM72054 TaxID=2870562 RepID=UPI0021AB2A71|nr:ALF repeat-containing protein [Streptomyces sp. TRM72054]